MKYLALLRQEGGCDYTIGCGINTVAFKAENVTEAAEKLRSIVEENYSSNEFILKSAHLYEVATKYEIDLALWYNEINNSRKIKEDRDIKDQELAEFERIKGKYNLS